MINYFPFALRVWVAGFMISPFVFIGISYAINPLVDLGMPIEGLLLFIIFGAVMSIPSLLLLWAITYVLTKGFLNTLQIKLTLSIVGVILTCLPFCLFLGGFSFDINGEGTQMVIAYSLVIVAAIWVFKLRELHEINLTEVLNRND